MSPPTPLTPTPLISRTRRSRGKTVYSGVIFLLVVVGFFMQFHWMNQVRESGNTDSVVSGEFASRLRDWMLRKKGLPSDTLSTEAQSAEKIPCETCMGSGTFLSPDGEREICPICLGVGFHMIRRFDPEERLCPFCSGMGRAFSLDTGEAETCPRCKGRGLILSHRSPDVVPEAE